MTTRRGAARFKAEAADNGHPRPDNDPFWSPPSFEDLVKVRGVAPYAFPSLPDDEDREDVDTLLAAIFGNKNGQRP